MNKTLLLSALACAVVTTSAEGFVWTSVDAVDAVCTPVEATFVCGMGGAIAQTVVCVTDDADKTPSLDADCEATAPKPAATPKECALDACADVNAACTPATFVCECKEDFSFDADEKLCVANVYKYFLVPAADAACEKPEAFTNECGAGGEIKTTAACFLVVDDKKTGEAVQADKCVGEVAPEDDVEECQVICDADNTQCNTEAKCECVPAFEEDAEGKCLVAISYNYKAVDAADAACVAEGLVCDAAEAKSGTKAQVWACFKTTDGTEAAEAEATLAKCIEKDGAKEDAPAAVTCALPVCAVENFQCVENQCECPTPLVVVDEKCVNTASALSLAFAAVVAVAAVVAF